MSLISASAAHTQAAGASLALKARPGDVFALVGELGAGKTEWARGFVARLNPRALVTSPSFSILNTYSTPAFPVHHFDFYRLRSIEELREIGFDEYVHGEGVCLIEWADLFPQALPRHAKTVRIVEVGEGRREIDIEGEAR